MIVEIQSYSRECFYQWVSGFVCYWGKGIKFYMLIFLVLSLLHCVSLTGSSAFPTALLFSCRIEDSSSTLRSFFLLRTAVFRHLGLLVEWVYSLDNLVETVSSFDLSDLWFQLLYLGSDIMTVHTFSVYKNTHFCVILFFFCFFLFFFSFFYYFSL